MSTGTDPYAKFSVSMPNDIKEQVEQRIDTCSLFARDRSSVIARDLDRYYGGLLKQGLRTLRNVQFSPEEISGIGTALSGTAFRDPDTIRYIPYSIEDAVPEMRRIFEVNPDTVLAKVRQLDLAALYALVDLIERDALSELA